MLAYRLVRLDTEGMSEPEPASLFEQVPALDLISLHAAGTVSTV